MESRGRERGAVLIGAIMLVAIFSLLGTVSMNMATQEIEGTLAVRDEAVARHLAEAGVDLVVRWFHDPSSAPPPPAGNLLIKQFDLPGTGLSFFDENGVSQFAGSAGAPDLVYDASNPGDDALMNDPTTGWFSSLRDLGRILTLKMYSPTRPGLLCTVEVTAESRRVTRTLAVQLGTLALPSIQAAVQVGNSGVKPNATNPLPVWVHWGDLTAKGNVELGKLQDVPTKTQLAPVSGQAYGDMTVPEDRWVDIMVGGDAKFSPTPANPADVPSNVQSNLDPVPGLTQDTWDYEALKQDAQRYGSYYTRDQNGLLYRDGKVEPGLGLTADEVFQSEAVGDHQGLVFVDTLDQLAPSGKNLGTLTVGTEYMEGFFVVNANLDLQPEEDGKTVNALSPPTGASSSPASRVPVGLTGVHVQGVLLAAGELKYSEEPRAYGAVVALGRLKGPSDSPLEVWYEQDLQSGLVRGLPLVYVAPGTWQEIY
ncbi:pilus assembly PilX N-terminal domain-containing protein [Nitrospiraceae bacterium AH_259_D15_M11_P09]|nr:pilus assembly PilX N-terminal domain-containing protein [Nitrospiraceae bacterium AH_259_D15_M11_P09]